MPTPIRTNWLAAVIAILITAMPVAAQQPPPADQGARAPGQGPMVVEPLTHSLILVPDVRFGDVNGEFGMLLGGYSGVVMDKRLLVGGGAYWLVNNGDDRELFYLGAVVGWYVFGKNTFDISVSGLIGGGQGTAGIDVAYPRFEPTDVARFGGRPPHHPPYGGTGRYVVWEDFFVAEPTVSVIWRPIGGFGVTGSVGYRLIAGAGSLNQEFQGLSGSVGIVFGGGR